MIPLGHTLYPLVFVLHREHKHVSRNARLKTFILDKLSKNKKTDVVRKVPVKMQLKLSTCLIVFKTTRSYDSLLKTHRPCSVMPWEPNDIRLKPEREPPFVGLSSLALALCH